MIEGIRYTRKRSAEVPYLGFSRSQAYTLMHAEGFPTIRIGKRMLVSREKFLEWLENHTAKEE